MLNNFINELEKAITQQKKYITSNILKENIYNLFILKYYCDNKTFSYEEIIEKEKIKKTELPIEDGIIFDIEYTHLLPMIQYCDLKQLIKEYICSKKTDFIDEGKKLYFSTGLNIENYDITGNTTYVIDQLRIPANRVKKFKMLDKILDINNKYLELKEVDFNQYKTIIIYDNEPIYKFIRNNENNIYEIIKKILINTKENVNIILQTSFKKISNMKDARYILCYLSYVLLYDEEKVFLNFKKKDNDIISIIDYNKDKIDSVEKLKKIIEMNRKKEDVLIKIKEKDIKNNYYRIGFKLYQEGNENKEININALAEQNAKMIDELKNLDKEIQIEIDKLMK